MQLQELLDHLGSEVLQDRPAIVSGGSSNLWSDTVLVRYLNQAQQLFARRTYCLLDATTTAVTQLALTAGVSTYTLHKSIVKVFSARLSDSTVDLNVRGRWAFTQVEVPDKRPEFWAPNEEFRKIRLYPAPDAVSAALTLQLRVARMPIADLTLSALTAEPEIPVEYHLDLCDWVAYKALVHQEVDGEAEKAAAMFRNAFELSMRRARRDVQLLVNEPVGFQFGGWVHGED